MLAETVPEAELVIYPSGGQVWVGREAEVFGVIMAFLRRIGYGPT